MTGTAAGLDSFASAAPLRQPQETGPLCRSSGVRVVVVWRPAQLRAARREPHRHQDGQRGGPNQNGKRGMPVIARSARHAVITVPPGVRRLFLGENSLARNPFRLSKYLAGPGRISLRAIIVL